MPLLRSLIEGGTKQVDNLRVTRLPIGSKGPFKCKHMSIKIRVLVLHLVGHGSSNLSSGRRRILVRKRIRCLLGHIATRWRTMARVR